MNTSKGENYRRNLRNTMLDYRNSLSADEAEKLSRLITAKLCELEPILSAHAIMGFASIKHEVELCYFMEEQAKQGKTILLPRVEKNGDLAAIEFEDWKATAPGLFGIREPIGPAGSLEEIDVVLVPGLVFDTNGYRLGYGKGYYDRFLKLLPEKTFVCGVCYDFQVVDNIMPHNGDVPMHWIVTELSELRIK